MDADILVINHDLLMSDLKLGGGVILPPLERIVLVIDEAHQLARVASDQFIAVPNSSESWVDQDNRARNDHIEGIAASRPSSIE